MDFTCVSLFLRNVCAIRWSKRSDYSLERLFIYSTSMIFLFFSEETEILVKNSQSRISLDVPGKFLINRIGLSCHLN